ncbi:restriction endonuclease subunit S [Acinetobacter baumannii]|uniref:restriction endonuclease subunit S n=1 Tax=Acinetobacter baumannii TaxID=470 RepID=UPI003F62E4C4
MSDWTTCSLGDFVYFQRGHDLPKTQMEIGEVPVAGSNGVIGYHNVATTKGPGITIGRSGNIGTPKFYKDDFWAHNTVLYVKDFKGNNPLFAYYFLRVIDFSGFNTGSAVPTLNRNHIHELEIKIPPIPEQKAIASVLSSLDDKIDLLHRQNKTLEAMAETLFRQLFIEEAKEDWGLESLGHHIQTINGVSYKSSELNPSNIALVTLKNFGRNGGLRTDGFKEFTGAFKDSQIMEDGDIAVAHTDLTQDASLIGNPIYTLNLLNYDKLVISMDLVKVNLTSNTLTKCFLFHLLKSSDFKDHALACSNGSSVIHLSKKALPSFQFKYPPAERIFSFTNLVEPMDQKIQKNLMQIQTLEKLRDTLLPKLMSGEVRVNLSH